MRFCYARGPGQGMDTSIQRREWGWGRKYDWSPFSRVYFPIRAYTNWKRNAEQLRRLTKGGGGAALHGWELRSSYNTPVTHVESSSGSFDTFNRSTLDSTSIQDCTYYLQGYRFYWGAGKFPSSGAKKCQPCIAGFPDTWPLGALVDDIVPLAYAAQE